MFLFVFYLNLTFKFFKKTKFLFLQIINLIDRVKHNSQPSVGEVLDQILEILRNSELYSPADLQNKAQDPMVSDLIEGLVTGPAFGHRRSSGGQNVISKSWFYSILLSVGYKTFYLLYL